MAVIIRYGFINNRQKASLENNKIKYYTCCNFFNLYNNLNCGFFALTGNICSLSNNTDNFKQYNICLKISFNNFNKTITSHSFPV